MSTKIYNGIKFKSRDWKEVLDQLISIKKEAVKIGNDSIKKRDLELFIPTNKLIDSDYFEIFDTLRSAIGEDYTRKAFVPNFKFSVILYPSLEGDIYGVYFNDINEYLPLLNPFFDEYCYYDNSDQPEDLTEEEWSERGRRWDEMVPDRFTDTGFKYDIVSPSDLDRSIVQGKIKEVMAYLKRDIKLEEIGIK